MTQLDDTSQHTAFGELIAGLRTTFRSGRTRSVEWRKDQLAAMTAMLEENGADFERALYEDLGRPPVEAYAADVGFTLAELKHLRKRVEGWMAPQRRRIPLISFPGRARVVPEPLGVALVIAPWNYPLQLLLAPVAAAIAAGNCVVAKPSELAPASSAVLARLVPRYLDDEAVALVEGGVPETTALLAQQFDHIFFTGSTRVGSIVMKAAAEHLTPVVLELGGKTPTIVTADADLEVAARRIVWGKGINAGQTCIAPDYVLAERAIKDRLVDLMVKERRSFYGDDPQQSDSFSRIVNDRHVERLAGLLASAGGTVVAGGEVIPAERYVAPTIVLDPDMDAPLMQEEIFGPILPVVGVSGVDEAIDFINARPKPLALYVFANSEMVIDKVVAETSSGGVCINHVVLHIQPNELPFGGVGASGMGAYHGKTGFDAFSHQKSVFRKPNHPDPPLLYPPYAAWKEKLVRKAL